ncbi:MAG: hypothetical protein NVS3B12_23080 [Acidimicrobiales bacterium]
MEALHICLPPTPSAAGLSRRALTSWLTILGLNDEVIEDAAVVISELVTNGVVHSPGGDIAIIASDDPQGITLDVTTHPRPLETRTAGPTGPTGPIEPDEHGRGLSIVAALVDQLVITDNSVVHNVRCRLARTEGQR